MLRAFVTILFVNYMILSGCSQSEFNKPKRDRANQGEFSEQSAERQRCESQGRTFDPSGFPKCYCPSGKSEEGERCYSAQRDVSSANKPNLGDVVPGITDEDECLFREGFWTGTECTCPVGSKLGDQLSCVEDVAAQTTKGVQDPFSQDVAQVLSASEAERKCREMAAVDSNIRWDSAAKLCIQKVETSNGAPAWAVITEIVVAISEGIKNSNASATDN